MQKRKAQNRAAQRAFRERKEKHLKDLETKVEDLEKASQTANNENNLLRAQIERLQVELREYRKRLSFMGSGHSYPMLSNPPSRQGDLRASRPNGDFSFEFPKFGDLPGAHMFNTGSFAKNQGSPGSQISPNAAIQYRAPGIMSRDILKGANSLGRSPQFNTSSSQSSGTKTQDDSFRPFYNHGPGATLQNPMNSRLGNGMVVKPAHSAVDQTQRQGSYASRKSVPQGTSNTNSPSTSSESPRGRTSSIGTSPEPTATSPSTAQKGVINLTSTGNQARSLDECEKSFYERLNEACGCAEDPVPVALSRSKENSHSSNQQSNAENNGENPLGLDWLIQQNGGQFDPVLFNDYREPQDAVLSQEFGSFFNDAFPLPDLSNSFPNFDLGNSPTPKPNLISQLDRSLEADEEVVPGEDRSQMLSCTKIWSVFLLLPESLCIRLQVLHIGIGCNRWRNSGMVKSMLTAYARNYAPRRDAPRVAWWSMRKMWRTL